ncbi:Enolase-phosphatase E1 [Blomia tropicalis]|nr:Enolase-phosphatase E1 [Blomia tropicalis]
MTSVLKIRKPKAIMMDFAGTMAKTGFISKIVFGYIRANVATYLSNNWGNRILMRDIDLLRAESQRDGGPIVFGSNESAEKIRESAASYVVRCHDEQRNSEAIRIFRFHMLFNGYRHKKVTTAIYSDVAEGLGEWASREHIEIFVYSNCWKYACKFMLQHTNHSDLSLLISDYFDTELGPLNDPKSYEKIVHKLGYPSQDILFLTKSGEEGKAAHMAGLSVVLVETHREDVDREVTNEITKLDLPFVRILSSLEFAADAPTASSLGSSSSCPTTWSTNHCSTATSGTSSGRGSSSTALSGSRAPPGRKSAPQSSKGSATRLSGGSRSSATRLSSGSRSSATRLSTSGASRTHSSGMLASSNKGSSSASATQISSGSASRGSSAPSSGGGGGASSSHGSSTRLSGGSSRGSATQLSGSAPRGSATQLSGSSSRGSATQISGSSSRGSATQISGSSSRGSSHQTSSGGGGSSSSAHSRSTHSR